MRDRLQGRHDQDLLARARSNDAGAFGVLYDRYAEGLYRHLLFRSSRPETAEDIVHSSFLAVWEHLRGGGSIRFFRAFLYRTAQNQLIDFFRRRSAKEISLDDLHKQGVEPATAIDLGRNADLQAEIVLLRQALATIPEHYRTILALRYLDELTITEIAEVTGKNPGAIYVSIHRGMRKLRRALVEAQQPKNPAL